MFLNFTFFWSIFLHVLYVLELKFNHEYIFCIVIFGLIFSILWKKNSKENILSKISCFKKTTAKWKNFAKHVHNCLPYKRVFKILCIHILISPNLAPILFINLLAYLDNLSSDLSSHSTHKPTCFPKLCTLRRRPHATNLPTKMTYLST
jgi:hypothetical protein